MTRGVRDMKQKTTKKTDKGNYIRCIAIILICCMVLHLDNSVYAARTKKQIKLDNTSISIEKGKTKKLRLKNNKKKVSWKSSNNKIVSIWKTSNNVVVLIARKTGKATITAQVASKKYSCRVTVKAAKKKLQLKKSFITRAEVTTEQPTTEQPTTEQPPSEPEENPTSSNMTYSISADGVMTVSINGDFDTVHPVWENEEISIKEVKVKGNNITSLHGLFQYCDKLEKIDLSELDTSNVTDMNKLFYGCSNLKEIEFGSFDTSRVTDMSGMFAYCKSITDIDVSMFDTKNVKDFSNMFLGCQKLGYFTSGMQYCLNVSTFDTGRGTDFSGMFQDCKYVTEIPVERFDLSQADSVSRMFYGCTQVESLDISQWDLSRVKDTSYLFANMNKVKITGLDRLDTSNVNDMSYMFYAYRVAGELDLSSLKFDQVTDMSYMFAESNLTKVIWPEQMNTNKLLNMAHMFHRCAAMTSMDLSAFDTSNVVDMSYTFAGCGKILSFTLDELSMSNVRDASHMFGGNWQATNISLANATIPKMETMEEMFYDCYSLESINIDKFVVTESMNIKNMFDPYCNVIPQWYTDMQNNKVDEETVLPLYASENEGSISSHVFWELSNDILYIWGDDTTFEDGENKEITLGSADGSVTAVSCDLPMAREIQISDINRIENDFFNGYTGVKVVKLDENVEYIGSRSFSISTLLKVQADNEVTTIETDAFSGIEKQLVIWCRADSDIESFAENNQITYIDFGLFDYVANSSADMVSSYTGTPCLSIIPTITVGTEQIQNSLDHIYYNTSSMTRNDYFLGSEVTPTRTLPGIEVVYYYALKSGYTPFKGKIEIKVSTDAKAKDVIVKEDNKLHSAKLDVTPGTKVYYSTSKYLNYQNYKRYGTEELPSFSKTGKHRIYYYAVPEDGESSSYVCSEGYVDILIK